jgi:hypothetical protein
MNFIHTDVDVTGPAVAIVTLNHQANVMLLDPMNYEAYCARRLYLYVAGGWIKRSPVRMRIPSPGRWHIVVDLYGTPGHISATVHIVDLHSKDPILRRRRTQPVPMLKTDTPMIPLPGQQLMGQLAPRQEVRPVRKVQTEEKTKRAVKRKGKRKK